MISEWKSTTLGEIAQINMGQSPSSSSYNEKGEGELLIQGNADIKNRKSLPRQWTTEPTKICNVGDILMTVRAPVGAIAKSIHQACIGRGVCSISSNKVDNEYLYQFLLSYESKWKSLEQGSTFTAVNGTDIKGVNLLIPPHPEQQKIAEILSTVDDKIEVIDQQISETQELKKGLMQRLLTKGIGHTEFKDSPLGMIPKSWNIKILEEINQPNTSISYGVVQPGIEDVDGVLFIRGGDIKNGKIGNQLRTISKTVSDSYSRTLLQGGELLISLVGYPGECAIVPISLAEANIARQVGIIRLIEDNDKYYIQQYLSSPIGKKNLLGNLVGSAQQVINLNMLRKVQVPLPSLPEQQKITGILGSIDEKLEILFEKKTHYQELKQGLMQQLLTGKIRVTYKHK